MTDANSLSETAQNSLETNYETLQRENAELRASCNSLRKAKDIFFRNAEAWEKRATEAEARIARTPADGPEPVAWQYRYRMWNTGDWSAWSVPTLDKDDSNDGWEWRPLFAHPVPADGPADALPLPRGISKETQDALDAIDANIRYAAVNFRNILVGGPAQARWGDAGPIPGQHFGDEFDPGPADAVSEAEVLEAWRDLLEKDDRTSPAEYPDMALITFDEFKAVLAALQQERDEARDKAHYATGTADLAMKHRDEAEALASSLQRRVEELTGALEHARHLMWEYGFSEDDLQPIRAALTPPEQGGKP